MHIQTFSRFRLTLTLDASEIFPDDPGQGTPAMVTAKDGKYSATYWCAMNEGELDGPRDTLSLTEKETDWLLELEPVVEAYIERTDHET